VVTLFTQKIPFLTIIHSPSSSSSSFNNPNPYQQQHFNPSAIQPIQPIQQFKKNFPKKKQKTKNFFSIPSSQSHKSYITSTNQILRKKKRRDRELEKNKTKQNKTKNKKQKTKTKQNKKQNKNR